MSIEDIVAQRTASVTPPAVECSTPLPAKVAVPEELAIPERILISIRDYYEGSFECGTWIITDQQSECHSTKPHEDALDHLNSLHPRCQLACQLFDRFSFQEAGQNLVYAAAGIGKIVLAEDPSTLRLLFFTLVYILHRNKYEIAVAILRQFSAMGELLLGAGHPLSRICGWLTSVSSACLQDILMVLLRSGGDHFENILGPMHRSTLVFRLFYLDSAYKHSNVAQQGVALRDMLRKCEQSCGVQDNRTWDIRFPLAASYMKNGNYVEANELAQDIVILAQNTQDSPIFTSCHTQALAVIAICQYWLGHMDSAVAYWREAIDLRKSVFGMHDDIARTWLLQLEHVLMKQGSFSAAVEVQRERKAWLESVSNDLGD